jgi:hypothetical protein
MAQDPTYKLAYQLITDLLSQQDILISINSGAGSVAEARIEGSLPFRIKDKWATLGNENRSWHIHVNMEEVVEARYIKEPTSGGKQSYSIRFCDSYRNLSLCANFIKLYDSNGYLLKEKAAQFYKLYIKYGSKGSLSLRG